MVLGRLIAKSLRATDQSGHLIITTITKIALAIVIVTSQLLKRYLKAKHTRHQLIHERCDESKGVFPKQRCQEKLSCCNHKCMYTDIYTNECMRTYLCFMCVCTLYNVHICSIDFASVLMCLQACNALDR